MAKTQMTMKPYARWSRCRSITSHVNFNQVFKFSDAFCFCWSILKNSLHFQFFCLESIAYQSYLVYLLCTLKCPDSSDLFYLHDRFLLLMFTWNLAQWNFQVVVLIPWMKCLIHWQNTIWQDHRHFPRRSQETSFRTSLEVSWWPAVWWQLWLSWESLKCGDNNAQGRIPVC